MTAGIRRIQVDVPADTDEDALHELFLAVAQVASLYVPADVVRVTAGPAEVTRDG